MFTIRKSHDRGHGDHGWLNSYHTFSFSDYMDPKHMGFRTLRVMNEDRVAPAQGFGTHGHRDMEIISYVLEGGLQHRDSMGSGSVLEPGDFQCMSAGSGVTHSEFNASKTEQVHFYQIWILPAERGLEPSYQELKASQIAKANQLRLVASPEASPGTLLIRQNARVYLGQLDTNRSLQHQFESGRHGWLQVLRGSINASGTALSAGDGLAISEEPLVEITSTSDAEVLLFDLN